MANRWVKSWGIPEDHWLRTDLRYIGAWDELIRMAESAPRMVVRYGKMIETERGAVYTSISELSDRWGLSRCWVRGFLHMLELDGMISRQQSDSRTSTIFISNYAKYQDKPDTTATPQRQQKDSRVTTTATPHRQQKPVSSEYMKEYTEYTEGESRTTTKRPKRFVPPTREELVQYSSEKGLGLNVDRFLDYYESNGWRVGKNPMKDWRAAARNWAAQDKDDARNKAAPDPKRFDNFEPRETAGSAMDEYIKRLEEGYD